MSLLCNCPRGAALDDIPLFECPESLGQVQKVIFQRIYKTGQTKNELIISTADPKTKASWTPLIAAEDGTKIVQSPYIQAPTTEPGAARTYGGGNETLGGVEIIIGREATGFTGNILRASQKTIKALKEYSCENVGVYLVDEFGRIAGLKQENGEDAPVFRPIPIGSFFVGDKNLGGLEEPDMNTVSWSFFPNWSDDLEIVVPEVFNALTDLVKVAP